MFFSSTQGGMLSLWPSKATTCFLLAGCFLQQLCGGGWLCCQLVGMRQALCSSQKECAQRAQYHPFWQVQYLPLVWGCCHDALECRTTGELSIGRKLRHRKRTCDQPSHLGQEQNTVGYAVVTPGQQFCVFCLVQNQS